MERILICGATSSIAFEVAKCFAGRKARLFLAGRSIEKLSRIERELAALGAAQVATQAIDLTDFDRHRSLVDSAVDALGGIDAVLIAHGSRGDQKACEMDVRETMKELTTNCTSVISLLTILANYFEAEKRGCIAVICSVAGDRGRQSHYVYGTAKGALSIFLQGLRNRLHKSGVKVITIKPGFVDTPMTAPLKKNRLFAKASTAGRSIYKGMLKERGVMYVPWFWRPIMAVVKTIPESVGKRLNM
jgi:decaprenylphospho-beta-D-erythro-pentofuranosid-2-ulose 2-reductase